MLSMNLHKNKCSCYTLHYSDELPTGVGGRCYYPLFPFSGTCKVVIRPKYEGDKGLIEHELIHVKQYSENILHALRVKFDKSYRYHCEIEAYSKQAEVYGYHLKEQFRWMAKAICENYDLNVEEESVMDKLFESCILERKL